MRRDRFWLAELAIDALDLIKGPATHRFHIIHEHMIWNYRNQLEAIAAARVTPGTQTQPSAPPGPPARAASRPRLLHAAEQGGLAEQWKQQIGAQAQ